MFVVTEIDENANPVQAIVCNNKPEAMEVPSIMYHMSPVSNRQSILQHGLQGKYDQTVDMSQPGVTGGIFLSTHPNPTTNSDVWQVDVRGLPLEEDWSTSVPDEAPEDERWYVVYQDIPPNRIKLISR